MKIEMKAGALRITVEDPTQLAEARYLDEVFGLFEKHFASAGEPEHRDLTSHHPIGFQAQPEDDEEEEAA